MASKTSTLASGGLYIRTSVANQGTATYTVNTPVAGTWNLWVRNQCGNSKRDTFLVTVDGVSQYYDASYNAWGSAWRWERMTLRVNGSLTNHAVWNLALSQGSHTIRFTGVDQYANLDAFILTNDMQFVPGAPTPTVNAPPTVNAGTDQLVVLPNTTLLSGVVTDDGLSSPLTSQWTQVSGPATASFSAPTSTVTTAALPSAGTYVFRLTANDGVYTSSDDVLVTATSSPSFVVSPTGSPTGDGSLARPWDLQTALSHPAPVNPGDTILLRGGTYKYLSTTGPNIQAGDGLFTSRLKGALGNPIRVTAYPGERPIIDGIIPQLQVKAYTILRVWGAHTWFIGLEIMNSEPSGRVLTTPPPCAAPYSPPFGCDESNRGDRRGSAVDVYGPGIKFINNTIHDAGQGLGLWTSASEAEAYGNLLYNNGWDASNDNYGQPSIAAGRLAGHGLYGQNSQLVKMIRENVIFGNLGDGMHLNGSGASSVSNFNLDGNIQFADRFIIGGPSITDITVSNSFLYGTSLEMGGSVSGNTRLTVNHNHLVNTTGIGFDAKYLGDVLFDRNTVWGRLQVSVYYPQSVVLSQLLFTNNTYYNAWPGTTTPKDFEIFPWGGQFVEYPFATWRSFSSTFDAQSTWGSPPTQQSIFYRPSAFDTRRGHLIVVNWPRQTSVSVPGSALGLQVGDAYELRNTANYYGDIIKGVFNGGSISIPLGTRTMAKPIGFTSTFGPSPFPSFGAFVLIKN